jgi:hypothetical protein
MPPLLNRFTFAKPVVSSGEPELPLPSHEQTTNQEKRMPHATYVPKFAAASLGTKDQTLDQINHLVASMLGRAGCLKCGRVALLRVDFLSDPPPDLAKFNVTSFSEQGFKAG